MYERFGTSATANGVEFEVVEGVKSGALRWFGRMMRMGKKEFVLILYERKNEGGGVWGRPAVSWIRRVSEHWTERVGSSRRECGEGEWQDMERHFCCGLPLEESSCEGAGHQRYR